MDGETLKALTDQGYAIKRIRLVYSQRLPSGFGDRALEQYYIQNRLANTFPGWGS